MNKPKVIRSHGRRKSLNIEIFERVKSTPDFGPVQKAQLADEMSAKYKAKIGDVNRTINRAMRVLNKDYNGR